jgi:excisionase family DNA binding protein
MDIGTHRILTVSEVSEFLRVHPSTIYRLLKENRIPAFRVASEWRFNSKDVERWTRQMSRANSASDYGSDMP